MYLYFLQFPKVMNSPLLREIHLEQNNLDNIEALSNAFLPLLEVLNLGGNWYDHFIIIIINTIFTQIVTQGYYYFYLKQG